MKLRLLFSGRQTLASEQRAQARAQQNQRSRFGNFRCWLHRGRWQGRGRDSRRRRHGGLWTGRNNYGRRWLRIVVRAAQHHAQNSACDNRRNDPPKSGTRAAKGCRRNRLHAVFVANNPRPVTHYAAIRQANEFRRRRAFLRHACWLALLLLILILLIVGADDFRRRSDGRGSAALILPQLTIGDRIG